MSSHKSLIKIVHILFNEKFNELNEIDKEEIEKLRLECGNTLLHYSAQHSLELCKMVLPKFKNINEVNIFDKTALHYCKDNEIKCYFMDNGMCY